MKCPGCGYKRRELDNAPEWQCPACKIAYNKHPNDNEIREYKLQVTYQLVPPDNEIRLHTIYLYLNSEDSLEYALLDERGGVKRGHLFDSELNGHTLNITNVLKNTTAALDEEQEEALSSAFAKKGYQVSTNYVDNKLEYSRLIQRKKSKRRQIALGGFLVILIAGSFFIYSPTSVKQAAAINQPALKNPPQQKKTINGVTSTKVNLQAKGINLTFISSKLYVVNALVKECRNICQTYRKVDDSCNKANDIMKDIHLQIGLYNNQIKQYDIDELKEEDQKIALEINQYLENIPKEMETAMNLCQRPAINVSKPQVKTMDFMAKGINLSILYSKIYTADNQIRDCRLHCEARSNVQTGCSIFITLQNEYNPELEELFNLMRQQSLNLHSDNLSPEDKKYIGQILNLLDDIAKERDKIIDCVDSQR